MAEPHQHPAFSFHIESAEASASHSVPASVLVQLLQNAQQAFELIGMQIEGKSIKQRARVSAQTSERFQLVCQIPAHGCFAMPVTVGGSAETFQSEQAEAALKIFQDLMTRVSAHSSTGWAEIIPDNRIRRRVLESVKAMAPAAGANWTVSLHDSSDVPFATLDQGTARFVQDALVPVEQREASSVITGELKKIDFFAHSVTLIYPPTSKDLVCFYDEEVEGLLLQRPRMLIQVTGRVLFDDDGQPKELNDVTDIRALDLSAFEVSSVHSTDVRLNAMPPLELQVASDESKQLLFVEDDSLNILAYGATREDLLDEINAQIVMLWREYAMAADGQLDAHALTLKSVLRERFQEVRNAA